MCVDDGEKYELLSISTRASERGKPATTDGSSSDRHRRRRRLLRCYSGSARKEVGRSVREDIPVALGVQFWRSAVDNRVGGTRAIYQRDLRRRRDEINCQKPKPSSLCIVCV